MDRRRFLGYSILPFVSATVTPVATRSKGGIGLTVKEWTMLYGEPDRVDKFFDPLAKLTRFQSIYNRSDYQFMVDVPLNDPDALIKTMNVLPNSNMRIEDLSSIAGGFIPEDSKSVNSSVRSTTMGDAFIDYSSEWLKKRVVYEQGPGSDGTFRIQYKRGRTGPGMYEWAHIGVGTYWFV